MAKEISELTNDELDALMLDGVEELPEEVEEKELEAKEPEAKEPSKEEAPEDVAQEEPPAEELSDVPPSPEQEEVGEHNNDKAFKGIRKELTHERERRRNAEQTLQALEERLKKLETPEVDPLAGYESDDAVPMKELKTTVARIKELEGKLQQQEAYIREKEHRDRVREIDACEVKARAKYSKQTVGEYDYDTVRVNGFMPLAQENPEVFRSVMNSQNPAEEAYRLGLSRLVDPYTLLTRKQANAPSKKPARPMGQTIGSVPASGGALAEKDADALSDSDIAKLSDKELDRLLK